MLSALADTELQQTSTNLVHASLMNCIMEQDIRFDHVKYAIVSSLTRVDSVLADNIIPIPAQF